MRNRAKCKVCGDIIESMHFTDFQICKCKAIGVSEGDAMRCHANDWNNFVRIDDEGKEHAVKVEKSIEPIAEAVTLAPSRAEIVGMLDEMVKSYESLPQNAMSSPITHYDLLSVLLLVSALFKASD